MGQCFAHIIMDNRAMLTCKRSMAELRANALTFLDCVDAAFGKCEAWLMYDTQGDGNQPAPGLKRHDFLITGLRGSMTWQLHKPTRRLKRGHQQLKFFIC